MNKINKLLLITILVISASHCKAKSVEEKAVDATNYNIEGAKKLQENKNAEALELFKKAYELNPHEPDYSNNIGVVLLATGKLEEALIYFSKATEVNPQYGRGYYNQGVCYQKLAKYKESIGSYAKSLMLLPNAPEIYFNMGIVYTRLNKKREARLSYEKFIETANPQVMSQQIADAKKKIKEL